MKIKSYIYLKQVSNSHVNVDLRIDLKPMNNLYVKFDVYLLIWTRVDLRIDLKHVIN